MKFLQKKPEDERIVAQLNKAYRIGFGLLSVGILVDLFQKWSVDAQSANETAWESLVLLAANLFVLVYQWRSGFMDDNAHYAESDTFPLRHYLLYGLAVGAAAGALLCFLKVRAGTLYAPTPLAIGILFGSMVLMVTVGCLAAYYLMFRLAKRRRARLLDEDDS